MSLFETKNFVHGIIIQQYIGVSICSLLVYDNCELQISQIFECIYTYNNISNYKGQRGINLLSVTFHLYLGSFRSSTFGYVRIYIIVSDFVPFSSLFKLIRASD